MKNKFLIIGSGASAVGLIYGLLDRDKEQLSKLLLRSVLMGLFGAPTTQLQC